MKIVWYENLYVGEKAKKWLNRLKWKLRHGAGVLGVYLLVMPSNEQNSLDILNAIYLQQPHYKKQTLRVVGIARSYEEAMDVLIRIVEDVYHETHTVDIRQYLNQESWQV